MKTEWKLICDIVKYLTGKWSFWTNFYALPAEFTSLLRLMQALLYSSSSIVTVSSTFSLASARSLTFSVTKKSCRRALSVPSWYIFHKELSPFKLLAWTVKQTHPPPMSASSVSAGRTWSPKLLKNWPIDSQLTKISAKVSAFRLTRSHVFKGTSENKIEKKNKK